MAAETQMQEVKLDMAGEAEAAWNERAVDALGEASELTQEERKYLLSNEDIRKQLLREEVTEQRTRLEELSKLLTLIKELNESKPVRSVPGPHHSRYCSAPRCTGCTACRMFGGAHGENVSRMCDCTRTSSLKQCV